MGQKKKKNPWKFSGPLYLAAAVWLGWSLIFPLKNFGDFFLCGIVSLGAWGISKMFIPKWIEGSEEEEKIEVKPDDSARKAEEAAKQQEEEKKKKDKYREQVKKRPRTGDEGVDKILDEEELALAELLRLDDMIEDEKVSAQIVHLEEVTTKIVNYVVDNPAKKNSVRRFFNYYLPTTLKLLNAYDRMDETGISGMNIDGTKGKVEEMMDTALEAFDKQLDALYADEALDITSDIKVMEGMLASEGLTNDDFSNIVQ